MTATQPWTTVAEPVPATRGNAPATAGFWLSVLGMVVGFVPVFGLLVTVPAALLSHAGRARFRAGGASTPGRSTVGIVLGWTATALCLLMTVIGIVGAATAPVRPLAAAPAAPAVPSAPVLLTVPNVVGMTDVQARDTLRAAGFTQVVLGPSTGSVAGVAAGTVTTQLPGPAALASAGDPITIGEAAAPPVPAAPVVVPQSAPVAESAATAAPLVADTDVDRPYVPAAPQPLVSSGSSSSGSSGGGSAYYKNCAAARAAGAAPLSSGDPGYRSGLDRDGDGTACE